LLLVPLPVEEVEEEEEEVWLLVPLPVEFTPKL
jgi:hypothetical protein